MPDLNMKAFLILLLLYFTVYSGNAQVENPFPKLTRHVLKTPKSLLEDLPALNDYLMEPCQSDQEKAWVIYSWISQNIAYDQEAYERKKGRINQNIRDILDRDKALCFGYAQLFQVMAEHAGLQSEIISGYSKGTLTSQPKMDAPDHAWNAVKLDGEWALLDVTWGSSLLQGTNDFVQQTQEGFFLTKPQNFILNHLPLQAMWQLLDAPIQASDFSQSSTHIQNVITQDQQDYHFQDSITAFLTLPLAEQKLRGSEIAYRFNPTPSNQNELGNALMDYAGRLSEQADQFLAKQEMEQFLATQEKAIQACERASTLNSLFDWQYELYADLLINQSVELYNRMDTKANKNVQKKLLLQLKKDLNTAQEQLRPLEKSFMAQYKIKISSSILESIEVDLKRLK